MSVKNHLFLLIRCCTVEKEMFILEILKVLVGNSGISIYRSSIVFSSLYALSLSLTVFILFLSKMASCVHEEWNSVNFPGLFSNFEIVSHPWLIHFQYSTTIYPFRDDFHQVHFLWNGPERGLLEVEKIQLKASYVLLWTAIWQDTFIFCRLFGMWIHFFAWISMQGKVCSCNHYRLSPWRILKKIFILNQVQRVNIFQVTVHF